MAANPILPRQFSELSVGGSPPTNEWFNFWRDLLQFFEDNGFVVARVDQLEARVAELEAEGGEFQIQGLGSVHVSGTPSNGVVQIDLIGDNFTPGATAFYGTDENGNKTWRLVESAFDVEAGELTKDVDGTTNAITFGLADLADSGVGAALVKITRDAKGRVGGTEAATTDDLTEGVVNQYFTEERAQDAVGSILLDSPDIAFDYDDGVPSISADLIPTGVVAGVYGDATNIPQIDVDANGRISNVTLVPVPGPLLALANITATQAIPDSAATPVAWDATVEDEGSWWSVGTPTRMTVPAGVTRVQVSAGAIWTSNNTGLRAIQLLKNGAAVAGGFACRLQAADTSEQSAVSAVLAVTAGDYFELAAFQDSGGALNLDTADAGTWLSILAI